MYLCVLQYVCTGDEQIASNRNIITQLLACKYRYVETLLTA